MHSLGIRSYSGRILHYSRSLFGYSFYQAFLLDIRLQGESCGFSMRLCVRNTHLKTMQGNNYHSEFLIFELLPLELQRIIIRSNN